MQGRSPAQRDVLIAQDAGVAKARRIMARLLADEQAEALAGQTAQPVPAEEAVGTLAVLDAARLSVVEGITVAV